jgi:hypothetical protein
VSARPNSSRPLCRSQTTSDRLGLLRRYASSPMWKMRLHIAFELISKLDKTEESRWLSLQELSLHDFLVEQIRSLQLVVEEQGIAKSLSQASIASAQDPLPSQPIVASVGRWLGVVAQISLASPVRDGGQVLDLSVFPSCGRDVMLSPPWQRCTTLLDELGENPCGAQSPMPPQISVPPLVVTPMKYTLTPRLRHMSRSVEYGRRA